MIRSIESWAAPKPNPDCWACSRDVSRLVQGVFGPVDDDDQLLSGEFFAQIVERLVPPLDTGNSIVEIVSDLFDELLALSMLGFVRCEEVDMWLIGTEHFEKFRLSHSTAAVDDVELVTRGFERRFEGVEFRIPIVECHTLDNDYCNNDLRLLLRSILTPASRTHRGRRIN